MKWKWKHRMGYCVYVCLIKNLYSEYLENLKNARERVGNPMRKQVKGQNGQFIKEAI